MIKSDEDGHACDLIYRSFYLLHEDSAKFFKAPQVSL